MFIYFAAEEIYFLLRSTFNSFFNFADGAKKQRIKFFGGEISQRRWSTDYCSPLWDNCNKTLKDKLQKYQNRAARIIAGASYEIRSADVLQALEWEN